MNIKAEYKFIIDDRLNENSYHMEENKEFLDLKDKYDVLYRKLEKNLQEEDKKVLDELNAKADRMNLEENYLSYVIGLADGLKLRNMLDEINCYYSALKYEKTT